eukprot:gene12682-biopygen9324
MLGTAALLTVEVEVGDLRCINRGQPRVQLFRVVTAVCVVAPPVPLHPIAIHSLSQWEPGTRHTVERRYSEAGRLRDLLCLRFRGVVIPPLPPKSRSSALQQKDLLQLFLQHVVGCPSEVLEEAFLTFPAGRRSGVP